ncbi:MAG: hypothetical protein H7Z17_00030 [Fuerstia sp.]|nr:hypothetical protein [Fuerstiella sp.]
MRSDNAFPGLSLSLMPLLYCLLPVAVTHAQAPGERPPAEIVGLAQPALDEGRRALEAQDAVAVRAAVAKAISVLGPWAGNPETATRYYPPIVTAPFDAAEAREWWFERLASYGLWDRCRFSLLTFIPHIQI